MTKFFKNYCFLTSPYMPYISMKFRDNPYLLTDRKQQDIYSLKVPLHIYLKQKDNKVLVYSMTDNWVEYKKNQEFLVSMYPDEYKDRMINLLENYTVNNQNITPVKSSIKWFNDKYNIMNKNILPAFIFPAQEVSKQYMVTKSVYDIRTLLKLDKDGESISGTWRRVGEFYE